MNVRLAQYIKISGKTISGFAKTIGSSQPSISSIIAGKRPLSKGMKARILAACPDLSERWLMTGEGPMLTSADAGAAIVMSGHHSQAAGRDLINSSPGDPARLSQLEAENNRLRAENAGLRALVEAKEEIIAGKDRLLTMYENLTR